jgi:hypothetical protein
MIHLAIDAERLDAPASRRRTRAQEAGAFNAPNA